MNALALLQDRYSLSDLEQFVGFIERFLSAYTIFFIAIFALIAAIAVCRILFDRKQSKSRQSKGAGRSYAAEQLKSPLMRKRGFERMSLDQSSAC